VVHSAKAGLVVHVVQAVFVVHSAKAGLVIHVVQTVLVVILEQLNTPELNVPLNSLNYMNN
jgi:hypothetical protein